MIVLTTSKKNMKLTINWASNSIIRIWLSIFLKKEMFDNIPRLLNWLARQAVEA